MLPITLDITNHKVVDHDALRDVSSHIYALEHFRDNVVNPSLESIADKLEDFKGAEDDHAIFLLSDFEDLRDTTVQGFMIAVQSMWERGLRSILCECEARNFNGAKVDAIKKAKWSEENNSLQNHFRRLIQIDIAGFTSYNDLNFLLILANAIRHGDGWSAGVLYKRCPSLWSNTVGTEATPPFSNMKVPDNALRQMIKSVLWFWNDIENIRCNSFRNKAPIVEAKLSKWRATIDQRVLERVWNVS